MELMHRAAPLVAVLIAVAPNPASAQQRSARSCDADEVIAWIGIEALDCNCTVRTQGEPGHVDPDAEWSFRSEPVVRGVVDGSPADGVLRRGDVIVAIDGSLITTSAGGRRFARRAPGRPMTFLIRRDGRTQTVRLTPVGICPGDPRVSPIATPRIAADGAIAPRPVQAPVVPRTRQPDRPVSAPDPAPAPESLPRQLLPGGRPVLGFGFACSECGWEREGPDDEPRWFFSAPPRIYNVDPGSVADRAGLRRGDIITHVDGAAIETEAGARAFGRVRPGQTVRLTYRRGGTVRTATLRADDRIGTADLAAMAELVRRELEELVRTSRSASDLRGRIQALAEQLEIDVQAETARSRSDEDSRSNALRYSGSVGNAEVEVRGSGSVIATILEPGKDLVIVTDGARIRIRVPDREEGSRRR